MYTVFANCAERFFRVPPQPGPPPGDEASTVVFRASPKYYRYRMLGWVIGHAVVFLLMLTAVIGCIVGAVSHPRGALILGPVAGIILIGEILLLLISWACVRLDYEKRWYVLTNRSLRVREGVVIVREMTITFANIQNLSISQGPLQRAFGIADLKVDTAGGGGAVRGGKNQQLFNLHTAWFRGVDDAPAIKELLQQRLRGHVDAGLGDLDDLAGPRAVGGGSTLPVLPSAPAAAASLAKDVLVALNAEATALRVAAERLVACRGH